MKSKFNAFLTGIFFATLQISYLFSLETLLTSSILSYFSLLFCWFFGAIIGLKFFKFMNQRILLILSVLSYYLFFVVLIFNKFNTKLLPFYIFLITASSIYAGYFFPFQSKFFKKINYLFFMENNGFILGILISYILFMLYGLSFLVLFPVIIFSVLMWLSNLIELSKSFLRWNVNK